MAKLEDARRDIDLIDREMAKLFERRMAAVADVAAYKQANGLPVLDSAREDAVRQKNLPLVQSEQLRPFYDDFLRGMMRISRQYQEQLLGQNTVAYQGVPGSFGHQVAQALYPHACLESLPSFGDIFEAVEAGRAVCGVVPFENSATGDVSEVLDLCYTHSCYIAGMYDLPISQNLLGLPGARLSDIRTVISHPQALMQSQRFLAQLNAKQQPFANTALAAQHVAAAGDITTAAVASMEAGALYGLVPLAKDIATQQANTTRFILLAKQQPTAGDRFSLLVSVQNGVGRLAQVISEIAKAGFDMENIKSRPMPGHPWEYYFYIELVGEHDARETQALLAALGQVSLSVRLLGVYRRLGPQNTQ